MFPLSFFMYNGLINVYKEPGYTSFDVVAVLRGILKQKKIGHTGTLDPAAEGVLLVCLGNATKLCDMLDDHTKTYKCRMLLGRETDTEDTTGKTVKEAPVNVSVEAVRECMESFAGDIMQVPPMYSALKKDGKKLCDLARSGIEIEREARPITIYSIEMEDIELPYVDFTVKCSKGTYIRSLCRDIGAKLGCGACMEHLTRTCVSSFDIKESLKLSDIEKAAKEGNLDAAVLPTEKAFPGLKKLYVREDAAKYIDNGNKLILDNFKDSDGFVPNPGESYLVYNTEGIFTALYEYDASGEFKPIKMFFS